MQKRRHNLYTTLRLAKEARRAFVADSRSGCPQNLKQRAGRVTMTARVCRPNRYSRGARHACQWWRSPGATPSKKLPQHVESECKRDSHRRRANQMPQGRHCRSCLSLGIDGNGARALQCEPVRRSRPVGHPRPHRYAKTLRAGAPSRTKTFSAIVRWWKTKNEAGFVFVTLTAFAMPKENGRRRRASTENVRPARKYGEGLDGPMGS
jgi:hypothetical protein